MTDTTNESPQVFVSNEILGAILTAGLSKSEVLYFGSDPKSFIYSALDADIGAISLSVVENGVDTINLALPYYADLERHSAEVVKDSDIADISGGEIIITVILVMTGVATVVGTTVGVAAVVHADKTGKNLDGSPK